jgi:CBS domain-containing protein
MSATDQSLQALSAGDLMTRSIIRLTQEMPLRDAARLLFHNQVSGAPVVNREGRCIGFLSTTDFLRLALHDAGRFARLASGPLPMTCSFQIKQSTPDGREVVLCTLPPGVCPIQATEKDPQGGDEVVCTQPHCVLADWQMVELEKLPSDAVFQHMTADPVVVPPDTPIRTMARQMIDAHIHRVIVVDEQQRPLGIVSSTDILAAVAYAENDSDSESL